MSTIAGLYITGSVGFSPVVTAGMGLQRSENFTNGLRGKEGGISARKAGQMWGLSLKKSTLQVKLNGRVTFHRRMEGPSSVFLNKNDNDNNNKTVHRLANSACKPRLWLVHGCVP